MTLTGFDAVDAMSSPINDFGHFTDEGGAESGALPSRLRPLLDALQALTVDDLDALLSALGVAVA